MFGANLACISGGVHLASIWRSFGVHLASIWRQFLPENFSIFLYMGPRFRSFPEFLFFFGHSAISQILMPSRLGLQFVGAKSDDDDGDNGEIDKHDNDDTKNQNDVHLCPAGHAPVHSAARPGAMGFGSNGLGGFNLDSTWNQLDPVLDPVLNGFPIENRDVTESAAARRDPPGDESEAFF